MDGLIEAVFGFQAAMDEDYVKSFYGDAAYIAIRDAERFYKLREDLKRSQQFIDDVAGQLQPM